MKISNLLETLLNEKYRPWRRKTDLDDFVQNVMPREFHKGKPVKVIVYGVEDAPNLQDVKIDYEV